MAIHKKSRLDNILVHRGLAASRSQARDLILRGCVSLDGAPVLKPSAPVPDAAAIAIAEGANPYVSRGGLKLAAALDAFDFDPQGRIALDIGASTGGFTDVLLARGAAHVFAIDVGRLQLHARLREDTRVTALEETDARSLNPALVPQPIEAVVADVSFISLTLALPAALDLATPGAWLVALVKPQFEAGREAVGKGGIVRDPAHRDAARARVRDFLAAQQGWSVTGEIESPIAGGSGNQEFLLGARYGA